MAEPHPQEALMKARQRRGEQLRALIVSWHEEKSFVEALTEQDEQVVEGKLALNDDWCVMSDEIYAAYMSQLRMTAWDDQVST
jgi:hypothetical protein